MTLELALIIRGDQAGAKRALDDTAAGLRTIKGDAAAAGTEVKAWAGALDQATTVLHEINPQLSNLDLVLGGATAKLNANSTALRGNEAAARQAGFRQQQLGFQLNDIFVGLASGQAPLTTFIQQGSQIAQVYGGQGGAGLALRDAGSFAKGLAGNLLPIVAAAGGFTLAATAFQALAGGAVAFFATIIDDSPKVEADLRAHKDLIDQIKGAYAEAQGAASSYGSASRSVLTFKEQQNVGRLSDDFARQQQGLLSGGLLGVNSLQPGQGPASSPLGQPIAAFRQDLRDGTADVIAFRTQITELASALPAADKNRSFAEAILGDTDQAAQVQEELQRSVDLLKGLQGNAAATATALGGTADKYATFGTAVSGSLPALREADQLIKSMGGAPGGADPIGKGGRFDLNGNQVIGFAAGGFTGHLPATQVAGLVHGREYVFDARATARIGVANLEAIRRGVAGYAQGGYVGPATYGAPGGSFAVGRELASDFDSLRGVVRQFTDQLLQTHNPLQAFVSVLSSVGQGFLNKAVGGLSDVIANGVAGLFGGGGGAQLVPGYQAGVLHAGGIVGLSAAPSRLIDAALFARAPRLHSGLAADEFPAILQQGEEVIPRGGRAGGASVVNQYWSVQTPDAKAFSESRATASRAAMRLLGRAGRYT